MPSDKVPPTAVTEVLIENLSCAAMEEKAPMRISKMIAENMLSDWFLKYFTMIEPFT